MKRFERRRVERIRRLVGTIGLSFALGALVDVALTWRLHESDLGGANFTIAPDREPAPKPADSRASERPGERGEPPVVATTGVPPPPEVGSLRDPTSQRWPDGPLPRTVPARPRRSASAKAGIAHSVAVEILRERDLDVPVDDVDKDDLRDTFFDSRNGHAHEAMDIMVPRHTAVRAVEDGTIIKLFNSQGGGGTTIYQFDPTGTFCYYYAHLDRYAPGLREGQAVERGQTIGYVGSTGNAAPDAPHLHFAIFRLTPERQWWKGEPVNPYSVFK